MEGVDQVEGGGAEWQVLDGGPQVDDVALDAAGRIETLKDVFVQVDAESATLAGGVVHGARAAALLAAEAGPQGQLFKDALEWQLLAQMGEVNPAGDNSVVCIW